MQPNHFWRTLLGKIVSVHLTIGCETFVRIPKRTTWSKLNRSVSKLGVAIHQIESSLSERHAFYFRKTIFTQVHFNHGLGMQPLPLAMQNLVLRPTLPIITPHCSWYIRRKRYSRCLGLCSMKTFCIWFNLWKTLYRFWKESVSRHIADVHWSWLTWWMVINNPFEKIYYISCKDLHFEGLPHYARLQSFAVNLWNMFFTGTLLLPPSRRKTYYRPNMYVWGMFWGCPPFV